MKSDTAIKVSNVSKSFILPHEQQNSLKGRLINFRKRGYEIQQALQDINFEVRKGEFFGIVGRNGSGKSTLLKLIAGIYTPDSGSIEVGGKLTPFIELGVGFNPELSGRDNVFLNGALLGFSRKEMKGMYDEIVEFAELERFMDQKLKNYSSGMQVRLAFSIAIRANTDILVLDEVLAVGDSAFQRKCFNHFEKLKGDEKTIILVTHDMNAVERFCDRATLINNSQLVKIGKPAGITKLYNEVNKEVTSKMAAKFNKSAPVSRESDVFSFDRIQLVDEQGVSKTTFGPQEKIIVKCEMTCNKKANDPSIILKLGSENNPPLVNTSTRMKDIKLDFTEGEKLELIWELPNIFNNGTYFFSLQVMDGDRVTVHQDHQEVLKVEVDGWKYPYSTIHPNDTISVNKVSTKTWN